MKSLFISTYNELITIGLLDNGKLISKKEAISNRSHSIYTVPLIDEVLKENNMVPKDLEEILVISGPGSFTGVRLGITVAKTLAYTINIPIKTITSIEALFCSNNKENVIITINDTKGVYYGIFTSKLVGEISYNSTDDFELIKNKYDYKVISKANLDIEKIYEYSKGINPTPAHAVKAFYVKEIMN